jgi:4-hydroxy-tetrahydrodipicolinate synthase
LIWLKFLLSEKIRQYTNPGVSHDERGSKASQRRQEKTAADAEGKKGEKAREKAEQRQSVDLRMRWCFWIFFLTISPLMAETIPTGIYAAVLTPLKDDLSCDSEQLASHSFELIERGCQGIALFGTTGEGSSFSVEERKAELEKLVDAGFDPKRIILANGSASILDTVELAHAALKHGCAALLVCPPSFYKNVQDEGVIAYYREVIRRTDNPHLKVLLYHIPQYSGVPISLKTIEALRNEFPDTVIGIKESEGNLTFTKEILQAFPRFQVFVGNERQIIEAVHAGGSGSICGIANLFPELIYSLYEQGKAAMGPNPQEIDAIFASIQGYGFIAAAKSFMQEKKGWKWRFVRPPLLPLTPTEASDFYSKLSFASTS